MRFLINLLISIVVVSPIAAVGFPGSGSGTESDPYVITNVGELQDAYFEPDAWYILGNDIDASDTANWNDAGTNDTVLEGFRPITAFTGVFDGQGHTITGLYINRTNQDEIGLFGSVSGLIRNTLLEDVDITGRDYVGGFVGIVEDLGFIDACEASGEVRGEDQIGGFAGRVEEGSRISRCSAAGRVLAEKYIGGFVGYASGGTIASCSSNSEVEGRGGGGIGGFAGQSADRVTFTNCGASGSVTSTNGTCGGFIGDFGPYGRAFNCSFSGSVSGTGQAGGFAGEAGGWPSGAFMTGCSAVGTVQGGSNCGGLVGNADRKISILQSYSNCQVTGSENVGGAIGYIYSEAQIEGCSSQGSVTGDDTVGGFSGYIKGGLLVNCYSASTVTGTNNDVGGLVGFNNGSIESCYATGTVSGQNNVGGLVGQNDDGTITHCYATGAVTGYDYFGGLIGLLNGSFDNVVLSYYDRETSGMADVGKGEPRTTAQMKQQATFAGWDFAETWTIVENTTYPLLQPLELGGWVSEAPGQLDPTDALPIDFQAVFAQPVTGLEWVDLDFSDSTDVSVNGGEVIPVSGNANSSTTWTLRVQSVVFDDPTVESGVLAVKVPAGAARTVEYNQSTVELALADNEVTLINGSIPTPTPSPTPSVPTEPHARPVLKVRLDEPSVVTGGDGIARYTYDWSCPDSGESVTHGPTESESDELSEDIDYVTFDAGETWIVTVTPQNSEGEQGESFTGTFYVEEGGAIRFQGWHIF